MKTWKKVGLGLAAAAGFVFGAKAKSVNLPFGYRQLEWIEGTGSQWICTDVGTVPGTIQVECVFTPAADYDGASDIFGGRNWAFGYWLQLSGGALAFNNRGKTTSSQAVDVGGPNVVFCNSSVFVVNATTNNCANNRDNNSGLLHIFDCSGVAASRGHFKLHSFKVWSAAGELQHDYLPVVRRDGKPGLYDVVNSNRLDGAFWANANTAGDDFVPGPLADDLQIAPIADCEYAYDGPCRPSVTVTDKSTGAVVPPGDYEVSYVGNCGVGIAEAHVVGKAGTAVAGLCGKAFFRIKLAEGAVDPFATATGAHYDLYAADGHFVYCFTNGTVTLTAKDNLVISEEVLVGGGGGGGVWSGGGGGAGALLQTAREIVVKRGESLTVSVGAGGAGAPNKDNKGGKGVDTVLTCGSVSLVAPGGGGGGGASNLAGMNGGCGGGGSGYSAGAGGASTAAEYGAIGTAGGKGGSNSGCGGGGGGAGAPGAAAGAGGDGALIRFVDREIYCAGGGGGGVKEGGGALGGVGGGGSAFLGPNPGEPGVDGLGGGGSGTVYPGTGGRGGSGLVLLTFTTISDAELGGKFGEAATAAAAATYADFTVGIQSPGEGFASAEARLAIVPKGTDPTGHYQMVVTDMTAGDYPFRRAGLQPETEYDWYVIVSNGTYDSKPVTGSFTTLASDLVVGQIGVQSYDFEHPCCPDVEVTDVLTGVRLTNGVHYAISYTENEQVGTATATVTALAPLAGTAVRQFTVVTAFSLAIDDIEDLEFTGEKVVPAFVVRDADTGEAIPVVDNQFDFEITGDEAEGLGTVTVSGRVGTIYEGVVKSANFFVVSPFPRTDYCELEWIASSGKQYIQTGLTGGGRGIDMRFGQVATANDTAFFGTASYSGSNYLFVRQGSVFKWFGGGASFGFDYKAGADYRLRIALDGTASLANEDGSQGKVLSGQSLSGNSTFYLFACGGSRMSTYRLYSAKLWTATATNAKFVPALQISDGVVGLYDVVRHAFYPNAGTGAFDMGPMVGNFRIDPIPLQKNNCDSPCRPSVVIRDLEGNVIDQTGFRIVYYDNEAFGTARALVVAPNDGTYFGGQIVSFEIVPVNGFVATVEATAPIINGAATPRPVVRDRDSGTVLTEGTDYRFEYENNTVTGTAAMRIVGLGDYSYMQLSFGYTAIPVFYADPTGGGDGSSWSSPATCAGAMDAAAPYGCEIWLKQGVYQLPSDKTYKPQTEAVVRGGFAGTETAADQRPAGTVSTIVGMTSQSAQTNNTALTISTAKPLLLERIAVCNGLKQGLVKSGAGDLTLVDCRIEACGKTITYNDIINGRGGSFSGGTLAMTNCVIANNGPNSPTYYGGEGMGLYLAGLRKAVFEGCLFVTNGITFSYTGRGSTSQAGGAAILSTGVPVFAHDCRFIGNVSYASSHGGIVRLKDNCNGSVFDHCLWVGNRDSHTTTYSEGGAIGALALEMGALDQKVTIENCTFAYNIAGAKVGAAAIGITGGWADIRNSLFYGNVIPSASTCDNDVTVASPNGKATISYTLIDHEPPTAVCDHLTLAPAAFVTPLETFLACINAAEPAYPKTEINANDVAFRADSLGTLLAFDVHALSKAGYYRNDGKLYEDATETSLAIDAGDPDADCSQEDPPNGGVLNVGFYGNTPEAARTPIGQPALDVNGIAVEWVDGWSQPKITVTLGIASGDDFAATVRIYISRDGVDWTDSATMGGVHPNMPMSWTSSMFLDPGTDRLYVRVEVSAGDATALNVEDVRDVEAELPPWAGKGGDPAKVVHYRPGATGAEDGTSWQDAFADLGSAFAALTETRNELWIAGETTYAKPLTKFSPGFEVTVRGGFDGTENTPDERTAGAVSTLDGGRQYAVLELDNAKAVRLERIVFSGGYKHGLSKTGAGDVLCDTCTFTNCTCSDAYVYGLGAYFEGTKGVTKVVCTNCTFSCNQMARNGIGGYGAAFKSCGAVTLDDCLFLKNGHALGTSVGQQVCYEGCAIYATTAPLVARNARFIGNCRTSTAAGGIVAIDGQSSPSAFTNCLFAVNSETYDGVYGRGNGRGVIKVALSEAAGTVDIANCTFVDNVIDGAAGATAGVNVLAGSVSVVDSIFCNCITTGTAQVGRAIHVAAGASATVRYSLFDAEGDLTVSDGGTLVTNNLVYGDPLFVTPKEAFDAYVGGKAGARTIKADANAALEELSNVHLRGGSGYVDEKTRLLTKAHAKRCFCSPALDTGDPASDWSREPDLYSIGTHGHRVNMGFYGNTPWATMTPIRGSFLRVH